jgi:hypothetical protein
MSAPPSGPEASSDGLGRGGRRVVGLAVALALAASAVGLVLTRPPPESGARPAATAAALTATLELPRLVREPRTVRILVRNHGAAPVHVREVELVTGSFESTGPVAKDVTIPPGGARGLAVTYGAGRCGGQAAPPAAPATARLVLAVPEGRTGGVRTRQVRLALPHPEDSLTMLLHTDCAGQVVARAADVRLTGWAELPDGRLRGVLRVERRSGDARLEIRGLVGSVLFTLATEPGRSAGPDPIGTLPAGRDGLEIPVVADAARCSGHAVGEAKQRFLFRTWVSVGAVAGLPAVVAVDPAGQDRLDAMLQHRCRL